MCLFFFLLQAWELNLECMLVKGSTDEQHTQALLFFILRLSLSLLYIWPLTCHVVQVSLTCDFPASVMAGKTGVHQYTWPCVCTDS